MAKKANRGRADREQFWRDLIARQKPSGQSIQEFCHSEGVSSPAFYSWRKRLRSANGKPRSQFLPVQVLTEAAESAPGRIEIVLDGGKRVRVEPGFDEQSLRSVLAVLEQSPC